MDEDVHEGKGAVGRKVFDGVDEVFMYFVTL